MRKFLIGVALLLAGCATPARQTDRLLSEARDIPDAAEVSGVPYLKQMSNQCGPATLTMAFRWAGNSVPLETVETQVFTPGKKGSFQTDMVAAARRNGMLAVPVQGMSNLLHEVAAGHPVVIFENLGLNWYPVWHYAIVLGYNLRDEDIILHDGATPNRRWNIRKFERSWMLTDYWGFTVLPPGVLSATADELAHATAGAGLEQIGKTTEAERVYASILEKWPDSLGALIGMGNLTYARGEFRSSVEFLRRATRFHPNSAMAWNNLATAEAAAKMKRASVRSNRRALALKDSKSKSPRSPR